MLTTENTEDTEAATPETDAEVTTFTSISKLKKRFECSTGKVSAEFARRLERERDEAREVASGLAEQAERLRKERDEARNKMADALQEVDLRTLDYERMKQERDEARRALRKFLKEVLQLIDSQDWKGFMESRETARKLLEGWQ